MMVEFTEKEVEIISAAFDFWENEGCAPYPGDSPPEDFAAYKSLHKKLGIGSYNSLVNK
jgi:hypothetical protein